MKRRREKGSERLFFNFMLKCNTRTESIFIVSIQLDKFSQIEHIHVASVQIKP